MPKFQSKELDQRYQFDLHFRQRVDRNQAEYRAYLAKANNKQLEIEQSILERFKQEEGHSIYFFYGYMQPHPGTHVSDLTLFFLKHFQPQPKEQFVLIYFNNETPSSEYYFEFKNILALLPLRIAENLKEFILVKPYFYHKAYDYVGLGSISKQFNERYTTLDSCAELCTRLGITVQDFVSFVPQIISSEFPKNIKRRTSLATYRINLQGQNMTEQQRKQKNEFEQSLKALITKQVYKLENYQLGDIGIPIIIQLLIHYFRTKPAGLSEEGIFRKSVSIDEENDTLNQLGKRNYQYLQHIENPHLIACLIKRFFTNLKQPIIPYPTYNLLLQDPNKKQHVKKLIKGLPKLNYMTLAFLIEFLKKDVLQHEKISKMSANNLAICFSPSLMRSQKASMADIVNAGRSVNITNILINNFQQIFGDQQQRSVMYKKSAIDRNKDFKKAIKKELQIQEPQNHQSFGYSTQFRSTKQQIQKQHQNPITPTFSQIKPQWPKQTEEIPTELQTTKSQNSSKRQHIPWNNNTINIQMTQSTNSNINSRLLNAPQSEKRIFSRQKNEPNTLNKVGSSSKLQTEIKQIPIPINNPPPQDITQIHFQQQIHPQQPKKQQTKTSSIYFSYHSKPNNIQHQ